MACYEEEEMYEGLIKNLESEKRHFTGCAVLALMLMLFMWVSSYMQYAQGEQASMQLIAWISAVFLVIFMLMVRSRNKEIEEVRQKEMAQPWIDWYNS